jgi:putative transcriptional regulator
MAESLLGRLLVSSPKLVDPNFFRTVVCICAHSEGGAMGVVLNRPMTAELGAQLPEWAPELAQPAVAFAGGPVDREIAIGVARLRDPRDHPGWTSFCGRLGILDLRTSPRELPGLEAARVFVGYTGWGAGQLESEIEEGAWFVVDVKETDPFTANPDTLYREVLQRQGGQLAMFAYFPPDASQN